MRTKILLFLFVVTATTLHSLTITSVQTLDSGRNPRTSFSNTETITLKIDCFVEAPVDRVDFKFSIYDPSGIQVFYHTGNSMIGRIGSGGSELKNIPLTFYTRPGEYTFKGEVVPVTGGVSGQSLSMTTKFSVYSANISLTYPPNGATDILAQPLVFRWVASGATKYKVYVDDDASFYKPLWTGETNLTEIEYPREPSDPLAKLKSGVVYWWKVEGYDSLDRLVARTAFPFSFSVKETTLISRDLAIETITIADSATSESFRVNVYIKNLGSQPESEVPVNVVISGGNVVPAQTISTIAPGQTSVLTFDCGKVSQEAITVSATLNFFDDNPKNNSLTKVIKLVEGKAKILGGVTEKGSKGTKPVAEALVIFVGPVNGSVKTNSGGQYKIENLPPGDYELKVSHNDYRDSETKLVHIEKGKAYPNIDFELEPKTEKVSIPELTLNEIWAIIAATINDKNVDRELEGFNLVEIELQPKGDINQLILDLRDKKAFISEYKLEK